MTYRATGAGESLIHPRLERSHNRRRLLGAQLPRYFKQQRLITARAYISARRKFDIQSHACAVARPTQVSFIKGDRSHVFLISNRGNSRLERLAVDIGARANRERVTFAYRVSRSAKMEHHEQAPEGAGSQMPMTMPRWPIKILSSLLLSAACCAAHTQGTEPAGEAPGGVATTNGAAAAKAAPAPDARAAKAAASYSLGLSFASQWREDGLDGALSIDDLLRGIRAGLGGTALAPDDRQRTSTSLKKEAYTDWAGTNVRMM
jgi:hypothetical protein